MHDSFHLRNQEPEQCRSPALPTAAPRCAQAVAVCWRRLRDLLGGSKCLSQTSLKYRFCCVVWNFSFAGSVDKVKVNKGRI